MAEEQANPENAGTEAPEQVQQPTEQPRAANDTQETRQEAPRVERGPDPDKRPPHREREFKPEVAEKFLEIPGTMDYLAEKLGVKEMQLELAREKAKATYGFNDDEIAEFGNTPDEIRKAAAIAAKYRGQAATPQAEQPAQQQGHRPAPPANEVSSNEIKTLSRDELLRKMAEL